MIEWLENTVPEGYATAMLWVGGALLLLFVVLLLIRLVRSLSSGTFVAGGRNRRARLAVMDATPVDSRRRLVLVRRDDVEHLILIGGSTDLVVERDIRLMPRQARPVDRDALAAGEATPAQASTREPAEPPIPVKPVQPDPTRPLPTHNVTLPRPSMPMSAPPVPPARGAPAAPLKNGAAATSRPSEPPWKRTAPPAPAKNAGDLDDALAQELEVSLDEPAVDRKAEAPSIDDEMNRILGELSGDRR